jgi:uncharacterized caspase-like protein
VRALLVGVGDYRADSGLQPVHAGADLDTMSGALRHLGVERQCVLRDAAATREGILTTLEDALGAGAQAGDHLLVHYAGHGVSVADQDGDEADGFDEALVPWGAARDDRAGLLVDDELAPVLDGLRRTVGEQGSVVMVVDACHSGSITRGAALATTALAVDGLVDLRPTTNLAPLVVFAAAGDPATAGELDRGTGPQGGLTMAWTEALLASHAPRTWGDLDAQLRHQLALWSAAQTPVFSGPAELAILGGPEASGGPEEDTPRWRVVAVEAADRVVVEAGSLHGLRSGDALTDGAGRHGGGGGARPCHRCAA